MNWGIFDIRLTQGWKIVTALMFLYAVVSYAGVVFVPYAAHLYPAAVLALGIVYFGGLRLWPLMALEVTLISVLSVYAPWPGVALHIISTVAQAVVGAYLLRSARIDPLFRKYRDTLILILSVVVISFVAPLRDLIIGMLYGREEAVILFRSYVSTFFCFLIITPFMLRWCTKPAFRRSTTEIFETLSFYYFWDPAGRLATHSVVYNCASHAASLCHPGVVYYIVCGSCKRTAILFAPESDSKFIFY
jgi:hypothetical protein